MTAFIDISVTYVFNIPQIIIKVMFLFTEHARDVILKDSHRVILWCV